MNKRDRELMRWLEGEGARPVGAREEDRLAIDALRKVLNETTPESPDPGPRFNAQILATLRAEAAAAAHRDDRNFLTRLAWTGAALVTAAAIWALTMIPRDPDVFAGREYFADVTRTKVPPGHRVSAVPIEEKRGTRLTVVWIDGLEYMPEGRLRR